MTGFYNLSFVALGMIAISYLLVSLFDKCLSSSLNSVRAGSMSILFTIVSPAPAQCQVLSYCLPNVCGMKKVDTDTWVSLSLERERWKEVVP